MAKSSKPQEDSGSGMRAHERVAREEAKKESWLRQLLRAARLSKGRPPPQSKE